MELSADKKTLWVTFRFAKKVGIIDLASRKLVQTIAVAARRTASISTTARLGANGA